MASTMPKPLAAKQLGELLQEQQEPFIIEAYLLERGCLKNDSNSEVSSRCCSVNSSKFLKRSVSCGLNKRVKVIPTCSKLVRALLNKLVSVRINPSTKNSVSGDGDFGATEINRSNQDNKESDRFSSASSTTVFNSCSESDLEDHISATADTCQASKVGNLLREEEVAADRKLRWKCVEDNKQLSPVSVLEEIHFDEGSPVHNNKQYNAKMREEVTPSTSKIIKLKKVDEDSKLAVSLCKLLVHSSMEKPSFSGVAELQEFAGSNPSSQYLKSKKVLQQTKQLLFDCVREVTDAHVWNNRRRRHLPEFLGPEELGKLLCENIRTWSKQSGDETNTTQLLYLDFLASLEEWNDFELQTREIGMKIGDAILEDISIEIVTDMIEYIAPSLC